MKRRRVGRSLLTGHRSERELRARFAAAAVNEHGSSPTVEPSPQFTPYRKMERNMTLPRRTGPPVPRKSPKVRATLYLPLDLLDEARDAAVHLAGFPLRLTLTKFAEDAFRAELERLKQRYNGGCDFPRREEDLKGGRPIAA
jgi:hypothetical protein